MGEEIERTFILRRFPLEEKVATRQEIIQAYRHESFLNWDETGIEDIAFGHLFDFPPDKTRLFTEVAYRIRKVVSDLGTTLWILTIKWPKYGSVDVAMELEVVVSEDLGRKILKGSMFQLEKVRTTLASGWEIDQFSNGNALAQIEFPDIQAANQLIIPSWVGIEVTGNKSFNQFNIAMCGWPL